MHLTRSFIALLFVLSCAKNHAQLGFCGGSLGEPIFTENFGNGMTYGPALPAGTTTYPFVTGAPQDGFYTLYYHSNQYSTWHYSLDHTPDETNGPNGKMLLMNAHVGTSGDFYKRTVSGLCVNTTFQFSAWLMNVYNPNTNYCGAGQIPINVRFEIWDATETTLLGSGNTGNIMGTPTPVWQQFALVFTTSSDTSVVLKMKNNGLGGCGNDLTIDDISFAACGELTTVSSPSVVGDTFSSCNPASVTLNANTSGVTPYVYQWQTSTDAINWTDLPGANGAAYTTPTLSTQTYYRVRAAQDLANLGNPFCSTTSNFFTVSFLPAPMAPASNGNQTICSDQAIPSLSVSALPGAGVDWYDAPTGGNLLLANSLYYTPSSAGTFYAQSYNLASGCLASTRTPVSLTIVTLPNASVSAPAAVCSGSTALVVFTGTPHAIVTYTVDGGAPQTLTLDASGTANLPTAALTANTSYTLVGCTSAVLASCTRTINHTQTIAVNASPTASVSTAPVCAGSTALVNFTGTPNAQVTYTVDGGASQSVTLDGSGLASVPTGAVTTPITYTLVSVNLGGSCTQSLSQQVIVSGTALPSATFSANPTTVCGSQTSVVSFTGTPNALVAYTVNGGSAQSITLNGAGLANINLSGLTGNQVYQLTSVSTSGPNPCTRTLSQSLTIAVGVAPTASFSSNAPVCSGSSATVTFSGTALATVRYSSNGGAPQSIVLNASGNASLVMTNVTANTNFDLIDVTAADPGGCMQTLSQTLTVSALTMPTATISANATSVCANQTRTVVFTGTPNAIVSYTVNGGASQSVTLNATGTATINGVLLANETYQLTSVSLADGSCTSALTDSVTIHVLPIPVASYTGNLHYCDGEPLAIGLSGMVGTTFSWTAIQNGTTGATLGSGNQIAQNVGLTGTLAGTVVYRVTPTNNGCTGNPIDITVTIHPLPVPKIADGVICTVGSGPALGETYTLDTQLDAASHTFQWFFGGDLIPGASASTYEAAQVGTYTVVATNGAGCVSDPVDAIVGEMQQGQRLLVAQSEPFADDPTVTVTVVGGVGPFLYQLDHGAWQSGNLFSSVLPGTHTVTVVDDFCTHLTATIKVLGYPKFFTPNQDGYNDRWNVSGIEGGVIRIFDRYGKLLKEMSTDGAGWDGTHNGNVMPANDYWFTIDYDNNGTGENFKAHFSLKR
ncbi:T9SS type B sorting domain-containing protein [Flavobacterium caeni]|uniref:Gliding motility-associated C-terminal domain-containing protein n=1 Tax=Flavobacterium caeni TaxID=490189 RepID=A0A1G5EPK8_9FLAO|nr:T9SS type B sorting domain-containing protein [Flavobacterium caeni]SCY28909.1 gliding motility-associated C-terminal domain-containing protein [Flavobacterium caeni]